MTHISTKEILAEQISRISQNSKTISYGMMWSILAITYLGEARICGPWDKKIYHKIHINYNKQSIDVTSICTDIYI